MVEQKTEARVPQTPEEMGKFATKAALGYIGSINSALGCVGSYEKSNNFARKWETLEAIEKVKAILKEMKSLYEGRMQHGK